MELSIYTYDKETAEAMDAYFGVVSVWDVKRQAWRWDYNEGDYMDAELTAILNDPDEAADFEDETGIIVSELFC